MNAHNIQAEHYPSLQSHEESQIMKVPNIPQPASEPSGLQTHEYGFPHEVINQSSAVDFYFFSMDKVQRELDEIREEVEETCTVADDVYRVPESAYSETLSLLTRVHRNIPMPDMMWLEDGGIGLEWRPGNGIVTMSLYGDEHVTFVAILSNQHKIAGTCPLIDSSVLPGFLATLPLLFRRKA